MVWFCLKHDTGYEKGSLRKLGGWLGSRVRCGYHGFRVNRSVEMPSTRHFLIRTRAKAWNIFSAAFNRRWVPQEGERLVVYVGPQVTLAGRKPCRSW